MEEWITFLTSALVGGEWLASRYDRFIYIEKGAQVPIDTRAGLDDVEKIFDPTGLELPPPQSYSPHSQSRYTDCVSEV
jgi:hypothetical protein